MKKVLVISVHPDDETIGCGGTILKHLEMGDQVYCLFITAGNEMQLHTLSKIVDFYEFSDYSCLGFPELELQDISLNILIPKISMIFNQFQPNILYIPNRSDIHSDHRVVFEAAIACTKVFRYPFVEKVLMCEVVSETDFAPALIESAFIPNVFNDISPFFEKKLKALQLFEAEMLDYPHTRNISTITAFNRYRGSQAGVEYAESFMLVKEIVR